MHNCYFSKFIISVLGGHCDCSPRAPKKKPSYATGERVLLAFETNASHCDTILIVCVCMCVCVCVSKVLLFVGIVH
jgi:hypothetical protein